MIAAIIATVFMLVGLLGVCLGGSAKRGDEIARRALDRRDSQYRGTWTGTR